MGSESLRGDDDDTHARDSFLLHDFIETNVHGDHLGFNWIIVKSCRRKEEREREGDGGSGERGWVGAASGERPTHRCWLLHQ